MDNEPQPGSVPAIACVCKICGLKFAATQAQDDCGKHEQCEHGRGLTDYCLPCGRINGG